MFFKNKYTKKLFIYFVITIVLIFFSTNLITNAQMDAIGLPGDVGDPITNETLVNGDRCCLGKVPDDPVTCLYSIKATESCNAGDILVPSGCIDLANSKTHPACSATNVTPTAVAPVATPEVTDIVKDLKITKPILEISIPKLKFTDVKNTLYTAEDGTSYIYIPYIGEYMTTVYQVGMVAANIIAVIMIIVVGVKITTLGGEQRVAGFKRIGQIVIGLFIAWGSYAILYTINPDLVNFKSLKVQYVQTQPITETAEDGGEETDAAKIELDKTVKKGTVPCDFPVENGLEKIPSIPGIRFAGKKDKDYLLPSVIPGLKKLGEIASKNGYVIAISTACRDLASQVSLAKTNSAGVAGGTVAHPGKSPHGFGYAIDVELFKDGKSLTHPTMGHATDGIQCSYPKEHPETLEAIKQQSKIFFEAGWVRLINESWHYEYGTAGKAFRGQCTGYASKCKQDGPDDCKA